MIAHIRVHRTRRVRDLIRGERFAVSKRFPGGREFTIAKEKTRQRAMKKALYANRPNGSPTAGGTYVEDYDATSVGNAGYWKQPEDSDAKVMLAQ